MTARRSLADIRIEAARGLIRIAERRALTRDEWDRVADARDQVEDSIRVRGDIDDGTGLGVLSIESIAKREPVPPNAYGIRSAPSKSKPGTTYELRRFGGAWACECKGYRARRTCDHSRTEVQRDRAADEKAADFWTGLEARSDS